MKKKVEYLVTRPFFGWEQSDKFKRILSGAIASIEYFALKKVNKKLLARLVGLNSVEELNEMLYTGMSKKTPITGLSRCPMPLEKS